LRSRQSTLIFGCCTRKGSRLSISFFTTMRSFWTSFSRGTTWKSSLLIYANFESFLNVWTITCSYFQYCP
jgi:hypothetical protein